MANAARVRCQRGSVHSLFHRHAAVPSRTEVSRTTNGPRSPSAASILGFSMKICEVESVSGLQLCRRACQHAQPAIVALSMPPPDQVASRVV